MKKETESGRTENIMVRVTPREKALIAKCAEDEGWGISEFMRGAAIMDMALSGNVEAMKIIFSAVGTHLRDKLNLRNSARKGEQL
jgi:hypothetical protein